MEATRVRWGPVVEWLVAAACIVAAIGVVSVAVRQLQSVDAVTPVIAEEAPAPEPPAVVPSRAISVPMVLLAGGQQLRVGERVSALARKLNPAWQVGSDALEHRSNGTRVTRTYDDGATQFLVVFEPEDRSDSRVVAIYLP